MCGKKTDHCYVSIPVNNKCALHCNQCINTQPHVFFLLRYFDFNRHAFPGSVFHVYVPHMPVSMYFICRIRTQEQTFLHWQNRTQNQTRKYVSNILKSWLLFHSIGIMQSVYCFTTRTQLSENFCLTLSLFHYLKASGCKTTVSSGI